MGELVGGGYTLLYVYYLVWYTDLGGRGVFRRLTSLLWLEVFDFDSDIIFQSLVSSVNVRYHSYMHKKIVDL